jgi:hypothetical protein
VDDEHVPLLASVSGLAFLDRTAFAFQALVSAFCPMILYLVAAAHCRACSFRFGGGRR